MMIIAAWKHSGVLFWALALLVSALTSDLRAQDAALDLNSDLSEAEFEALLGRLSDEQVRDIVITEFASRRADLPDSAEGIMDSMRTIGATLSTNASTLFAKWPTLGDGFDAIGARLSAAGGIGLALFALGLSLAVAFVVRHFWRQRAAARQIEIAERNVDKGSFGTLATILDAAFFLVIELSSSIAFALTAMATLYLFFGHPDLRFFVSSYVAMVTVVLIVRSILDFMFPRHWPIYRLVAISDEATRLVHWVVLGLACLWMFETVTSDVMAQFGAPEGTPDLFSLLLGLVWIIS
ncbi:MAG: hypothetical protein AAGA73_14160, partial [Pseudomonadota bacterium]